MRYVVILVIFGCFMFSGCEKASVSDVVNPARKKSGGSINVETATFGGGCFWGTEATFRQVDGVTETAVGYMGGKMENPTYELVCTGGSGHAEVVQVKYDPDRVDYEKLLEVFWASHNPTTLNRQGPDVGTQYRSVIFFHDLEQEAIALASKVALQNSPSYQNRKIVTEIAESSTFNRAEDYHQQYLEKRGLAQCHF